MKTASVNILTFFFIIIGESLFGQDPFLLSPNGNTQEFFKYVTKDYNIGGAIYHTGMINLSGYKLITSGTTGIFYNTSAPVQKLQLQGGNILLCRTNVASTTPDLNPTSRNGAILFSDNVLTANNWIHGKWGIEYDDQFSSGGLNFFKPVSSLTSERLNFNLFIRNNGNVGIGTGSPATKLQVSEGDIYIDDIESGIIMKSPDGNCWRGNLNNSGQLVFSILQDCPDEAVMQSTFPETGEFEVSPNPASGQICITLKENSSSLFKSYTLMNPGGSIVTHGKLTGKETFLDTSHLPKGLYLLQVSGKKSISSEKIIVN